MHIQRGFPSTSTTLAAMQSPITPAELRERLRALIGARHGSVTRRVVGRVARDAGVEASTLARYFGFYPGKPQTVRLQEATLRSLLLSLGVDPFEFLRSISDRQMDLWPAPVGQQAGTGRSEATDQLRAFADAVRVLPLPVQLRVVHASILAGVGSIADAGETVPEGVYEMLRHLDVLQRDVRQLRLVAS
jgi:hypothetical protein